MTPVMTQHLPEPSDRYQANEGYRSIARALVERFASLRHIALGTVLFVDDLEGRPGSNGRLRTVKVQKLSPLLSWLTGWEFVVTVFKQHTADFSRQQLIAMLYHALRHIGPDGKLTGHDIEEWADLYAALGADWATTQRSIPDLLGSDIDWTAVKGRLPRLTVLPGGLTPIERMAQGDPEPEDEPSGLPDDPDEDEVPF